MEAPVPPNGKGAVVVGVEGAPAQLGCPYMGKAGDGLEWHHLVEKHKFNLKRFGAEALHNTENVIPLNKDLHAEVSAVYSSKRPNITNSYSLTVREWIRTQSYEEQRSFALLVIEKIRTGEW